MSTKQVAIYLSRGITLARKGVDTVKLQKGRNLVDKDVAEHEFVVAHRVDEKDLREVAAADAALVARVDELQKANDEGAALVTSLNVQVADLDATVESLNAKVAELEQALAAKQTELDAMVAAMTKATEPAAGAGKQANGKK